MKEQKYTAMTPEEILEEMLDEDAWITSLGRVQLETVQAELRKLRSQVAKVHTYVECAAPDCKRGVRHSYAPHGLCTECAEKELTELRKDVTRQIEAVKDAEREIKRLRGIERATMLCNHGNLQSSIEHWRMLGRVLDRKGLGFGENCRVIADALEAE